MNRKNTILIAVAINVGLLMILFITALTTPEELSLPPSLQIAEPTKSEPLPLLEPSTNKPLFTETLEKTLPQPEKISPPEAPVVHPLPERTPAPTLIAPPLPSAPPPAPISSNADYLEIIVKKGDSLDKLAKEHRTSVSELIKLNRLPSSFLRIGQQIKIPLKKSSPPKPSSTEEPVEFYTIKVGDNPWSIAHKHHMKVEELLRLNGLNEEKAKKLKPGDRLRIKHSSTR